MENYQGFVYEWTNKVTGLKYIGSHYGKDDDYYVGSGVDFLKDLKAYGLLNYDRKILEYVLDSEELPDVESKWLKKVDAKNNPLYLNKTNYSAGSRKPSEEKRSRPLCSACNSKLSAIAYHRNNKTYYRSLCNPCNRKKSKKKLKPQKPRWQLAGYKKKPTCDRCGFRARHHSQLTVYHVNGNLDDCETRNLKTICLNCIAEVVKLELPWRPGDLEPDR